MMLLLSTHSNLVKTNRISGGFAGRTIKIWGNGLSFSQVSLDLGKSNYIKNNIAYWPQAEDKPSRLREGG